MTLTEYLLAARRGWWIVLGAALLGSALAGAVVVRQPIVYSATSQFFVAAPVTTDAVDSSAWYDAAGVRVTSYVAIGNGNVVAERVAQELGGAFDASVVVSVVPNTVVIDVTARGADPQVAADVAAAYAQVIPVVIDEVEQRQGGMEVVVTSIEDAETPEAPETLPMVTMAASGALLGLGLGMGVVILRETVRRERRGAPTHLKVSRHD